MDEDSSAKDNSDDDIHEGIEDSSADDSDDDDLHSLPSLVERCPDDDSDSDDDSLPSLMERQGWKTMIWILMMTTVTMMSLSQSPKGPGDRGRKYDGWTSNQG